MKRSLILTAVLSFSCPGVACLQSQVEFSALALDAITSSIAADEAFIDSEIRSIVFEEDIQDDSRVEFYRVTVSPLLTDRRGLPIENHPYKVTFTPDDTMCLQAKALRQR